MNFLMVFDFTQFWLDDRLGNVYFQISHKISDLSDSSYCVWSHITHYRPSQRRPPWPSTHAIGTHAMVTHMIPRVSIVHINEYVCGTH